MYFFLLVSLILNIDSAHIFAQSKLPSNAQDDNCDCDCNTKTILGITLGRDDTPTLSPSRNKSRSIADGIAQGKLSPFAEFTLKQSSPDGDTLHMRGFRLGIKERGRQTLGLGYYRSNDGIQFGPNTKYQLQYGGLVWGGMPEAVGITQFYGSLLFGAGQTKINSLTANKNSRLLLALEPEVGLAINVTAWLQLGFGVSYRYLSGLQIQGISSDNLRGWTANAHLRLH